MGLGRGEGKLLDARSWMRETQSAGTRKMDSRHMSIRENALHTRLDAGVISLDNLEECSISANRAMKAMVVLGTRTARESAVACACLR